MLKVALTGPNGLIGSHLLELGDEETVFIPLSHDRIEITDQSSTHQVLGEIDFDILLHLAAYTDVEGAEREKDKAYQINVIGTKNISEVVTKKNKKMIYVSTDFVFDGVNPPFYEDSKTNPQGYYGWTKYEGEKVLNDNAMIVRISYPYGSSNPGRPDFSSRIQKLLEKGSSLTMITDSSITPTFIGDICHGLYHLLNSFSPEVYHLVGSESLSPYEAGLKIAEVYSLDKNLIKPIKFSEFSKGKAPRPQFSEIKSKKNDFQKMKGFEPKRNST